jgi:hypothetical protein
MKEKNLAAIVFAFGVAVFGFATLANDKPSRFEKTFACMEATETIPHLIEAARYGTGPVYRTKAWFENLLGAIGDLLSLVIKTRRGELSRVSKAVVRVDFLHTKLHFRLMTILYAEYEAVEELMPSKLSPSSTYINQIRILEESIVAPHCRSFLR